MLLILDLFSIKDFIHYSEIKFSTIKVSMRDRIIIMVQIMKAVYAFAQTYLELIHSASGGQTGKTSHSYDNTNKQSIT